MAKRSSKPTSKKSSRTRTTAARRASKSTQRGPASMQDFSAALQSVEPTAAGSAITATSFNQMAMMWVIFFLVNSVVLFLVNLLFPQHVVLGNDRITSTMGLLLTSALLSVIIVGAIPIIELVSQTLKYKLSDSHWMVVYLVVNTVTVWLLARLAEMLGFGISSWVVALLLGFVLDLAQGIAMKSVITPLTSRVA